MLLQQKEICEKEDLSMDMERIKSIAEKRREIINKEARRKEEEKELRERKVENALQLIRTAYETLTKGCDPSGSVIAFTLNTDAYEHPVGVRLGSAPWNLTAIDDAIFAPHDFAKVKVREWIVEHPEEFIDIMLSYLEAEYGEKGEED